MHWPSRPLVRDVHAGLTHIRAMSAVWAKPMIWQTPIAFAHRHFAISRLTAPYGHNGAYPDLEGIIRHHLDPQGSFDAWQKDFAQLPEAPWLAPIDFVVWQDRFEIARVRKIDIKPRLLADDEVAALVDFMGSLTGASVSNPLFGVPDNVPSGLPVDK